MPIYEYRCEKCSQVFEKITWNSKNEIIKCPYCNGEKVHKLLSTFSKAGRQGVEGLSLPSTCGPSSSGFS
jgi:putative FmdB family regulatory protein